MCTVISKTAEYAIHAALWLADHPGQPWTAQTIAAATNIPAGYLGKVLQLLGRSGLVRAQPGPGGGFLLSRAPRQIDVLAVVHATDPLTRNRHGAATNDDAPPLRGLSALQARLNRAVDAIEEMLRTCTLADLLLDAGAAGGAGANANGNSARAGQSAADRGDTDPRKRSPEPLQERAEAVAGDPPSRLKKGNEQ